MFTITITGNTVNEIFEGFETLLKQKGGGNAEQPTAVTSVLMQAPVAAPQAPAPPQVPIASTQAPIAPAQNTAQTVTPANMNVPLASAPTYTFEQLANAGATLASLGKVTEARNLLGRYGVSSVAEIKPEQYGMFAADLRALGVQV